METNKVIVLPYNKEWVNDFEQIKLDIEKAIGDLIIGIEHVGSTSVEGMMSKPCIDIDIIINDYSIFKSVLEKLEEIGYIHEGNLGIEDREAFRYINKPHLRNHHLYVCPKYSKELHRHITFRDFLRNNSEIAKRYSLIKVEAAKLFPNDIDGYMKYKNPIIEEIYELCGLK